VRLAVLIITVGMVAVSSFPYVQSAQAKAVVVEVPIDADGATYTDAQVDGQTIWIQNGRAKVLSYGQGS
jgi:hypothetical protein